MANSSGLNERPSRTSLRGVATLYQGSMLILLRSLHAREQPGCWPFQPREVCVGHRLEAAQPRVHPIPDAVGNDHITENANSLQVPLALFERPFDARAEALRLDHEVTVLRRARERPEHRDVDASPLD